MKIGLIAHYGEDYYKSRMDFLSYLDKKGNSTFAFVPEDDYRKKIESLGGKVYFYKYSRSWKFIFSLISTYFFFVSKLKKEKTDTVFTYKFFPNIVGIIAARRAKVSKIVATIAGIGFLERREENFLIKIIFSFYMWVLNKADYVITQNIEDLKLLQNNLTFPQLILTNGSGVNSGTFLETQGIDHDYINENGLSLEKKYITFCSRIVKEKGIIELVESYNNIDIDYELIIAGWFDEKGLEEKVLDLIKNNPKIHYLGYQKNVLPLLSVTEVVILPSYYPEGVPRSLIEALALSKIIITTDHKGCKETCIDNINGFLVMPKSVDSLSSALKKINFLNDKELLDFKTNSLKLFQKKFDSEVVYKTIWNGIQ
ncbi:glycosyltransferase [Flavobacterium aquicola]|uniref:Glycosyltransferase involved in cell wall biosynthesis n=1 Tax=Flavobacterium aquicola TaxID=1682742 RepID=A0A3E0ELP6_9FLAO|nr:glycosyltransferase [Flavobacterium aquicola]REG98249.1 glycosyltransferase involved in cell wall biosynthesis [Flavobacterium aquicola]